ncbi:MAG: hypothetical protein ACLFRG_21510 [Desulfococcaceae bacterium]
MEISFSSKDRAIKISIGRGRFFGHGQPLDGGKTNDTDSAAIDRGHFSMRCSGNDDPTTSKKCAENQLDSISGDKKQSRLVVRGPMRYASAFFWQNERDCV